MNAPLTLHSVLSDSSDVYVCGSLCAIMPTTVKVWTNSLRGVTRGGIIWIDGSTETLLRIHHKWPSISSITSKYELFASKQTMNTFECHWMLIRPNYMQRKLPVTSYAFMQLQPRVQYIRYQLPESRHTFCATPSFQACVSSHAPGFGAILACCPSFPMSDILRGPIYLPYGTHVQRLQTCYTKREVRI